VTCENAAGETMCIQWQTRGTQTGKGRTLLLPVHKNSSQEAYTALTWAREPAAGRQASKTAGSRQRAHSSRSPRRRQQLHPLPRVQQGALCAACTAHPCCPIGVTMYLPAVVAVVVVAVIALSCLIILLLGIIATVTQISKGLRVSGQHTLALQVHSGCTAGAQAQGSAVHAVLQADQLGWRHTTG
jgi:hypothetical protein